MELEEKLKAEALELANKLDIMDRKSNDYATVLDRYQTVMRMLDDETKRLNSTQQLELEKRKQEMEFERYELELEQKLKEMDEELKKQRRSNIWQVALKIAGGVVAVAVNLVTMYFMIRFNNSGETLTSMESKFIFPEKIK